jgi:hypothetical protein
MVVRNGEGETFVSGSEITRRGAIVRLAQWSLGIAATASGLVLRSSSAGASILPGGCCDLFYTRYCTALEWTRECGTCEPDTTNLGYPTGKWWWSCYMSAGRQRLCGECFYLRCSYTFIYNGSAVRCNKN